MECVTQLGVIDTRDPHRGSGRAHVGEGDESNGALYLVEEGDAALGSLGLPTGARLAKIKPDAGSERIPVFPSKLGWTIAFPFEDRRNGGVIGIDDFAVIEPFALGQTLRLWGDLPMGSAGGFQVAQQTLALRLTERGSVVQEGVRLLGPGLDGLSRGPTIAVRSGALA